MKITSLEFAAFSFVTLIVYYLLPRRPQNWLLLGASYLFLAAWSLEFAAIFALMTVANYALTLRVKDSQAALWAGVGLNLAALAYLKYADFFITELADNLGIAGSSLKIALPIGFSYYILQAISTLLDIRRGLLEPTREWGDYALYMVWFPRLTSGPIERAREFLPKLAANRIVDNDTLARSFSLLLMGLVRKVAIADVLLVMMPETIFDHPKEYPAPALGIWLLAYGFALYNDFAGYTSIVRGVSGLFGLELSQNFNTPYFARNFTEFWQRWHISLSNWLRDYIFTPLTRASLRRGYNSRHLLTVVLPPMVTMLISGLWHEARWGMLLWGGMHGVFQVLERARSLRFRVPPPEQIPAWRQGLAMLFVTLLALLAWVPFRTDAFPDYWLGLLNIAEWLNPPESFGWGETFHIVAFGLVGITLLMDILHYRRGEFGWLRWPAFAQALLINLGLILILLGIAAQGEAPPPFIYQGF